MDNDQGLVGEVAILRRRLAELEVRLAATAEPAPEPERATRRGMLRLAGAVIAGGAAAALVDTRPAAAGVGTMQYGTSNNSGADETTLTSSSTAFALQVTATNNNASAALRGIGTQGAHGVYGRNDSTLTLASGVWGGSATGEGYGVTAAGGRAQVWLAPAANMGPSSTSNHNEGELAYDEDTDALWVCVAATGAASTWRKLGGVSTAGSLHVIPPARSYDSRKASPGPQATLATGANRLVSVANKYNVTTGTLTTSNVVPAGATAIAYNVTVVNTVGTNGYLAVNDGGNTTVAASIINWTAPGQTIANSSVVKLNSSRQITVICGGTSTSCNFIIDVLGYYL